LSDCLKREELSTDSYDKVMADRRGAAARLVAFAVLGLFTHGLGFLATGGYQLPTLGLLGLYLAACLGGSVYIFMVVDVLVALGGVLAALAVARMLYRRDEAAQTAVVRGSQLAGVLVAESVVYLLGSLLLVAAVTDGNSPYDPDWLAPSLDSVFAAQLVLVGLAVSARVRLTRLRDVP
jgi:hypothetical protein